MARWAKDHRKQRCLKIAHYFVHEDVTWPGCSTSGASVLVSSQNLALFSLISIFLSSLLVRMCLSTDKSVWFDLLLVASSPTCTVLKGTFFAQRGAGFKSTPATSDSRDHSLWPTRLGNWLAMTLQDVGYPHSFGLPQVWFGLHSWVFTGYFEIHGKREKMYA